MYEDTSLLSYIFHILFIDNVLLRTSVPVSQNDPKHAYYFEAAEEVNLSCQLGADYLASICVNRKRQKDFMGGLWKTASLINHQNLLYELMYLPFE